MSPDRLVNPASRYVVQAGAVILAALITGIRSDLPGQVTAQVTEHVYDSPTGKYLFIPQGSKLIGVYDSQVSLRGFPSARQSKRRQGFGHGSAGFPVVLMESK